VTIEMAFEFFKITSQLVQDIPTLKRVVFEIIEDFYKQNTAYLELRSTPKPLKGSNSTSKDYIQAICDVMQRAEEEFDIKVRYVVSINRQAGVEAA
jgi:adenosine deaminase